MNLSEFAGLDGLGLADLVRKGEVTPAELCQAAAEGCEKVNPDLGAVIEIFEDRLQEGGATPKNAEGPFAGVPYFLKDNSGGEKGRKQEWASPLCEGRVVPENSYLVDRFQKAGLVSIGRTTLPEMGFFGHADSAVHGRTSTPWAKGRTSGGSSGGSAASVSAGIVPIAHGSDIGGSIRIPASFCGVVGLKPTRGRVSTGPGFANLPFPALAEFVLTRTVRDCAAMLDAVEGPGPTEERTVVPPDGPFLEAIKSPAKRLKVGFTSSAFGGTCHVHNENAVAVRAVAKRLEEMGHLVEEATPNFENYADFDASFFPILIVAFRHVIEELAQECGRSVSSETMSEAFLKICESTKGLSADALYEHFLTVNEFRTRIGAFFDGYDILLTPSNPTPPPDTDFLALPVEEQMVADADIGHFSAPFNASGHPAISLPLAMTSDALPIGIQFVGRFGDEATLLKLAASFEEAVGWNKLIPPIHVSR